MPSDGIVKVKSFKRKDSFFVGKADIISINTGLFSEFYRMGKMVGQGAFGEVRECFTKEGNNKRAVKLIMKSHLDKEMEESFKTEVATLKILDHPNILKLYEVFEDKKKYFLVTELCKGGELFDEIIEKGTINEKDASNFIH